MPRAWCLTLLLPASVSFAFPSNIIHYQLVILSGTSINYQPKLVQIFFDTATFVEIEKDRKVTWEAQLGVIGGTMGLLTGFSILSAVQIIYYLFRMVLCPNQQRGNSMVIK